MEYASDRSGTSLQRDSSDFKRLKVAFKGLSFTTHSFQEIVY